MRMSEWLDQDNLSRKEGECPVGGYPYGFMDDGAKKDIRRSILKAVAIPGYQVPYGSREMPIARGWGTGGIQITLSLIKPDDILKVIDQGDQAFQQYRVAALIGDSQASLDLDGWVE